MGDKFFFPFFSLGEGNEWEGEKGRKRKREG